MDVLGITREELSRTLLKSLVSGLLDSIKKQPKEVLTKLLIKTLPFITVPDLREIPRAILTAHTETPDSILKVLGTLDKTLIADLPKGTRRVGLT